ncbi:MAG: 3-ketoacyl-(acyl-carrier-protein) reductase [Microgenomates group bacterium GW2011_GWD1_33_9]|nr:MAG: 3-ketoacyl-(acyl-carrier-protein) reductase [Microgenomates group bacterium GW2011_GWD1_33_9]
MHKNKKQKVAVVTGSSKGIGKAIAIRLARDDYYVYVTSFSDEVGGKNTVTEIEKTGGKASLQELDVTEEQSVLRLMKLVGKEFGYLDVLINNAERDIVKTIEDSTFEEWKLAIDTKLHGAWLSTKYAIPLLKKSKNANIIMISSNADERPAEDILSYATATAALTSFTKSLAIHLPKYGIRVNAVMPGQVRTDNWGDSKNNDELWKKFAEENPFKRVATVEDIADATILLINDPHKFLNGNFLFVNGGSHLK